LAQKIIELGKIKLNNGKYAVQGHSYFKVTTFGTNRKPTCDFLLVNNILSCTFSNIGLSWITGQIVTVARGVLIFNAFVRGEPLKICDCKILPQVIRDIVLYFCGMMQRTFR